MSEQRFRTATEAVSGILWTNDLHGEMHGEQPAWSSFTGQTIAEYSGFGWASAVHPEDAQPTIDAWTAAVQENRLFVFEHRLRRHDGVYRLCSIRALPVRNTDGSIREWVGVHTDITEDRARQEELKQAIAALRRQEELVEVAQVTNDVGFWRLGLPQGEVFLSSGNRRLFGLLDTGNISLSDVLGRIHAEDVPMVEQALKDALITGHYTAEFRVETGTPGEHRWLLGVARLLANDTEAPYLVGMNLDITQSKQSADALMRSEKLAVAGRLAASIAHEINNPLEAVTNLLYLLMQTKLDEEQRSYCDPMMAELVRVSQIATHTLRFHRQTTRATPSQIGSLVESVLALFDGRIKYAHVSVECRMRKTQDFFAFEGEIRQVLANLIGNAVDAMAGAEVGRRVLAIRSYEGSHLRTGKPGIYVTIADTGPGIPSASLSRIFDAFFTTKGDTGTGLGLWVSMELTRKNKGEMRVRSSQAPQHHGTVFRLFLPLRAEV